MFIEKKIGVAHRVAHRVAHEPGPRFCDGPTTAFAVSAQRADQKAVFSDSITVRVYWTYI